MLFFKNPGSHPWALTLTDWVALLVTPNPSAYITVSMCGFLGPFRVYWMKTGVGVLGCDSPGPQPGYSHLQAVFIFIFGDPHKSSVANVTGRVPYLASSFR